MTEIHLGEAVFSLGVATSIYAGNRVRWWIKRRPRKDPLVPITMKAPPTQPPEIKYSAKNPTPEIRAYIKAYPEFKTSDGVTVSKKRKTRKSTRAKLRKAALNRSPETRAKYSAHAKSRDRVGGRFT